MSQYLEKLDGHLSNIQQAAEEEQDPHRSKILWNYLHHGAFEVGGDWERIFTPEMIVEDPHYEMRTGSNETVVLDGQDSVKEFYSLVEDEVMMLIDDGNHHLFVNDDAMAEFGTTVAFMSGEELLEEGINNWYYEDKEIDDPGATYLTRCRHGTYWPYSEDAQLIGEMVYQLTPYEISKADTDEVPTLEGMTEVAEQYYPEDVDGPTPYRSLAV